MAGNKIKVKALFESPYPYNKTGSSNALRNDVILIKHTDTIKNITVSCFSVRSLTAYF